MLVKDHVFVVTGGASGLGEAVVRTLVGDGGKCIVFDMSADLGRKIESALAPHVFFYQANVIDEASVQSGLDAGVAAFGAIHGVINCAGVGAPNRVIGKGNKPHPLAGFDMVVKVNLIGTFNVLRLAAAIMAKQELLPADNGERGVIINVASVAAFDGQIGQAAYSASKAGVVGMTLPIARELAAVGIRVNCIAPGLFLTPMLMQLPEKAQLSLGSQVPFPKRLGKPSEFASLVKHMIENSYMNGETVRVDGSIRMSAM